MKKQVKKPVILEGEWQNTRVYKNAQNRAIIAHILYMDFYPLDNGDYAYYFIGNFGNVCISFEGAFTDDELKAIANHIVSVDYSTHNLKLVSFCRTNHNVKEYANSLKVKKS